MEDDSGHPDAATSMAIEKDVELLSNAPAGGSRRASRRASPLTPRSRYLVVNPTQKLSRGSL
jgi:hypothetical protein